MIYFGDFLKPEGCSQKVLPDRSILIGQKLKNIKWDILGDFQAMCKNFQSFFLFLKSNQMKVDTNPNPKG